MSENELNPAVEVIEPPLFAGVVADEVVSCIQDAVDERGRCAIALAGGSTPGAIYRLLARPPRVSEVPWASVHLYWGDERWVSPEDNQSNFRMTQETLLAHIPPPGPVVHQVDTALSSPEAGARAYAEELTRHEGEAPVFDLVLLGIGEDGHTASLFPGSPLNGDRTALCGAAQRPEDSSWRVTICPRLITAARRVVFIIKGESKAAVAQEVIEGKAPAHLIPARIFEQCTGRVTFFLDSGAAQRLSRR